MKRIMLSLLVAAMLFTSASVEARLASGEYAISSGEVTAAWVTSNGAVVSNPCYLVSLLVVTDGSNDAKVVLYDNTAGSGKVVAEVTVRASDNYGGREWSTPLFCPIGLYPVITGTGASCFIEYIKR